MSFLIPIDANDSMSDCVKCPRRSGRCAFDAQEIAAVLADVRSVVLPQLVPQSEREQLFVTTQYWEHYQGPWSHEMPEFDSKAQKFMSPTKSAQLKSDPQAEWRQLNIPPGTDECYWRANLGDFGGFKVPIGNVLIVGPNGSGKTHLAACIAKVRKAFWTTGDEVSSRSANDFPRDWEFRSHLVIDDLMRGRHTDFGLSNVVSLIARRLDSNLRTIVTCDKNLASISEVDRALSSRLNNFSLVTLKSRDRRKVDTE